MHSESALGLCVCLLSCLPALIHGTSCTQAALSIIRVFKTARQFNMIFKYCLFTFGRLRTSGGIYNLFALGA